MLGQRIKERKKKKNRKEEVKEEITLKNQHVQAQSQYPVSHPRQVR